MSLRAIAGLIALGVLIYLAAAGPDPVAGRARPPDRLTDFDVDRVTGVVIEFAGTTRRYTYRNGSWLFERDTDARPSTAALAEALEITSNASIVRSFGADGFERGPEETFGFGSHALRVRIAQTNRPVITLTFGGRSPDGNLRYARRDDSDRLYLVSAHVVESWKTVAGGARPE